MMFAYCVFVLYIWCIGHIAYITKLNNTTQHNTSQHNTTGIQHNGNTTQHDTT